MDIGELNVDERRLRAERVEKERKEKEMEIFCSYIKTINDTLNQLEGIEDQGTRFSTIIFQLQIGLTMGFGFFKTDLLRKGETEKIAEIDKLQTRGLKILQGLQQHIQMKAYTPAEPMRNINRVNDRIRGQNGEPPYDG